MTATRIAAWPCIGVILLAAGCAIAPERPPVKDRREAFNEHVREMHRVDEWELRGRLAVKTRERGETVSMIWRRDGGRDHYINLYGPMGAGRVVLTQNGNGATLRDSEGKTYHDDSPEEDRAGPGGQQNARRLTQHWVLGATAPGSDYELKLDRWGRLSSLTQNGWKIRFEEYHYIDGRDMPRKLVMNALPGTQHIVGDESGEDATIRVKALIRRWEWSGN